jgi:hypothetical protein
MRKSIDKLGNAGTDEYDNFGRVKRAVKKDGSIVEFDSYTPALGRILTTGTQNNSTQTAAFGTLTLDPNLN